MSQIDDLSKELDELLKRTAKFVRAAFHVHSPESHDWPKLGADRVRNDKTRFLKDNGERDFLDELSKEFEIVCITDHMKCSYACKLARAAQGRGDISVFPGMEVNCIVGGGMNERIHLLVIFPPDKGVTAIDRIFSHSQFPEEEHRNGQEDYQLPRPLQDWASSIESIGGLLVIAHVDDHLRGHRAHFRAMRDASVRMFVTDDKYETVDEQSLISEQYKQLLADSGAHAVEVMKPEDKQHYLTLTTTDGNESRVPCVLRSDFHCLEDLSQMQKKTFIKVSRLDFDCVRDALRFYETRIKFKGDLLPSPSPRIVGLRLRSASGRGLFKDAEIAFNENLNCIIGPRGCGKSTIIESIRYVFGQNVNLKETTPNSGYGNGYSELAFGIQRANLVDTIIELIFETEKGERVCLRSTYDDKEDFTTEVLDLNADRREVSYEGIKSNYPVRIYSWSEIENLGRKAELQRSLVDRLIERLPEYAEERKRVYLDLGKNRLSIIAKCAELEAKLNEETSLLKRYTEFKNDFERVNTPDVAKLFEELDRARERVAAAKAVRDKFQELVNELEKLPTASLTEIRENIINHWPDNVQEWWDEKIAPRLQLSDITDSISRLKSESHERVKEKIALLEPIIKTQEEEVKSKELLLRERTQTQPDEELLASKRELMKKRYDSVVKKREEYIKLFDEFTTKLTERDKLIIQLEALQDQISGARLTSRDSLVASLNKYNSVGMDVSITFNAGKDRLTVIHFMREGGFLSRSDFGNYRANRLAERCCFMAAPTRIARAILTQNTSVFEAEGVSLDNGLGLNQQEAQQFITKYYPFEQDDNAEVTVINTSKLGGVMELQEKQWDDELRIVLNGKPVDELSPGQRSSAMLPLIALAEDVPLIIDQPEDNLDNRMVGETLTRILADLKERRQIIVATHNPNIVVGGDAEQVIVLDAPEARSANIIETGSIDHQEIVEYVVDLLEGGRAAFLRRNLRYKRHLGN